MPSNVLLSFAMTVGVIHRLQTQNNSYIVLRYIKILIVLVAFFSREAVCAYSIEHATHRPNIVLVLIDDLGWGDFSCFGNREMETTNIDRLAANGLRFKQFYVNSPICSPSRIAISTGQYPARWRITSYLSNRSENERRGIAQWLDPQAPMLARILHEAGYATGHFGKWHMGGQRDVGDAPLITEYGFDKSLTNFEGLGPRILPLLDAYDGRKPRKHALGSDTLGHGSIRWERRDQVTKSYIEAAIDFIDSAQDSKRPFYVNLWPDDVHSPFFPPKDRHEQNSKRNRYFAVLKTLDEQLGMLFNRIANDRSLRENTLIIICSDNGPEDGAGSAGPFRGNKGMLYEGGIRSPLLIWGPGLINTQKFGAMNTSSIIAAIDMPPSLIAMSGIAKPRSAAFDGESLPDVLLGLSDKSRKQPVFFRRPPDRARHKIEGALPDLAVRSDNWKLVCGYDGSDAELYDLAKDPAEKANVAKKYMHVVKRLTDAVVAWNNSMPADKGVVHDGVNKTNSKRQRTGSVTNRLLN
jgi:uncharacterized sulfatase